MKTQILAQYEPPSSDWLISDVVSLNSDIYAVYRTNFRSHRYLIDICGDVERSVDISAMVTDRQVKHHRLFGFGDGFGLCDHNNTRLLLWADAESDPCVVRIEQAPDSEVQVSNRYLAFASYDASDETLLLGLNDRSGYVEIARYLSVLKFSPEELFNAGRREITVHWKEARELDLAHFPPTQLTQWGTSQTLEWLSINHGVKTNNSLYVHTKGGSHSRSKTGPEYEFSVLARFSNGSEAPETLDVSERILGFTTDKRFIIAKPKRRKCLLVYDLDRMALAFEVPLRPNQNMAGIQSGHGVRADIRDNRLYVSSLLHLNVCELIA
ncbi:MAG: hypothetical protein QNJ11_20235 [Woeseiaceae bacterium]|nr:hypothetical protein [Woeseiaceae bacterium]